MEFARNLHISNFSLPLKYTLLISLVLILGIFLAIEPSYISGALIAILFLVITFISPKFFINILLLTGGISLAFIYQSKEIFLPSLWGLSLDGLKFLFVFAAILLILATRLCLREINLTPLGFMWTYILFLVFCAISIYWSNSIFFGIRMVGKISFPILFFLLIATTKLDLRYLKKMERFITFGSLFVISFGLLTVCVSIFTGINPFFYESSSSVYRYKIISGFYVSRYFSAPMSMYHIANYYQDRKILDLILFFAHLIVVFSTLSRASIFALSICLSCYFFLTKKKFLKYFYPLIIIFSILLISLTFAPLKQRFFYDSEDFSFNGIGELNEIVGKINTSGRLYLWNILLSNFFYPSPLIGSGAGSTNKFFEHDYWGPLGMAHSDYVRLLCEVGIIGLLLFAMALITLLIKLIREFYKSNKQGNRYLQKYSLISILCLIFFIFSCGFDNVIDIAIQFIQYNFIFIGICFAIRDQDMK